MSTVVKDLGAVSAYAYAVEKGYTGTEAEFAELMADYAEVGQRAEDAADSALESKSAAQTAATTATNKASEATTAAQTATAKATEASTSASTATSAKDTAVSASQTATSKATEATTAAATATSAATTATTAKDDAVSAKTAAQTAQTGAETAAASVQSSAEQIATNAEDITQLKEELTRFETIIPILAGRGKTWAEIKQNVKMGYGEILYPVGTDFSVDCPAGAPYDSIVWTVVGHRVENDEHIMTMLMKHVIYGLQFDAPQAIIVPDETMAAGTYHFKLLNGYDTAYDGGKSVQFTLANDLAAGCQIVMNWPYNQTWIGKNITVYGGFGTTVIETCVMSEGTGGTDLGDADGTVSILNHTQRARYGSNNYKESALREWLNSGDAAGLWQTQQTRFQRPCSYAANRAGFATYLDPEFAAVIREGTHLNRTNEVFDLNGKKQAYSTTEKFFLPSQEEIGFSPESGIVCGTVFDFYGGAAQSDKIKYDITAQTTARNWWLRTPYPSSAHIERVVRSSGALNGDNARNGIDAVAACEI